VYEELKTDHVFHEIDFDELMINLSRYLLIVFQCQLKFNETGLFGAQIVLECEVMGHFSYLQTQIHFSKEISQRGAQFLASQV
jgi:hypothetical protein